MRHWIWHHVPMIILILTVNILSVAQVPKASEVIMVVNIQDSGPGSFREALELARAGTVIRFAKDVFPRHAPATIHIFSELPPMDDGYVTIDASQAGVILDGSQRNRNSDSPGLGIISDYNLVMGLEIRNFPFMGILIFNGNYNIIGGKEKGEGNIVSENRGGININGENASYNQIVGNLIGTDSSGTVANGNVLDGMWIGDGAHHNQIGGSQKGEGNLISGNHNVGIVLEITDDNLIAGNLIGTDISGTKAIGNKSSGIVINMKAKGNVIGGNTESERNIISSNGAEGIFIGSSPDVTTNAVIGNYIGTDITGKKPLGNKIGIVIAGAAIDNKIGPNNKIGFNEESGIIVAEPNTTGNLITQNSIFMNGGSALLNQYGGNREIPTPEIIELDNRQIKGTAAPHLVIEVFSDSEDEAEIYEGTTIADAAGFFDFMLQSGSFQRRFVTVNARDAEGNTSQLSNPKPVPSSGIMKELPNIVAPSQVSVEPAVVGTNLGLALFSVLFFGVTTAAFNNILKNQHEELKKCIQKYNPNLIQKLFKKKHEPTTPHPAWWRLVLFWLAVMAITALIESFLDPDLKPLDVERIKLFLTLFAAGVIIGGLEWVSDLYAHRLLSHQAISWGKIQWVGMVFAIGCVLLSRRFDFTPGYIYGILGAVYVLPKLIERKNSGKRALLVQAVIFSGGWVFWICSALLPIRLLWLETIFLTVFLVSLQGVLFELLPLGIFDGSDIWRWKKGVWIVFFGIVFFCFYHFILNPNSSDVQALQQNGVITLGLMMLIFGLITLILWLLIVYRKKKSFSRK